MLKNILNKLNSIAEHVNKYGHYAVEEAGKSKIRQFLEIIELRRLGFHESEYYILLLYNGDRHYTVFKTASCKY